MLKVGVGVDAVDVILGIEFFDFAGEDFGVAGKDGVVGGGWVGIVGEEGDVVAPIAADVVV